VRIAPGHRPDQGGGGAATREGEALPQASHGRTPEVSVIIAAYNRSNVLRYAIESVRWQTRTDWELLVVDDAGTDDTADVLARFADARIRYTRLAVNVGEQSGPNNEGLRQARGRYIAFLNQDDLWLPHHLDALIAELEATGADLVFPLALQWNNRRFGTFPWCLDEARGFTPGLMVPASLWVFRRELVARIGLWRNFRQCHGGPSHDWLFRAYRAGAAIRLVRQVTVIKGRYRQGAYADRIEEPNRRMYEMVIANPRFGDAALARAVAEYPYAELAALTDSAASASLKLLRRCLAQLRGERTDIRIKAFTPAVNKLLSRLGINPVEVVYFIKHGRKGQKIENLRVRRGLAARPASEAGLVD
jgi:glycosyltransferase involved in cell wall biosynthesis